MDIYKILETLKNLNEGNKFAGQAVGQKPGDQVRGTEKATAKKSGEHPFKGRLVGANESIEQEIKEGWESYLAEYGATNTSAAGTANADDKEDPVTQAAEIKNTQDALNKLKSAGANVPSVSQATASLTKEPTDPKNPTDIKIATGMGQELEQLIDKGDPNTINTLAALIRKTKQGGTQ
jgi:hypothetical protein